MIEIHNAERNSFMNLMKTMFLCTLFQWLIRTLDESGPWCLAPQSDNHYDWRGGFTVEKASLMWESLMDKHSEKIKEWRAFDWRERETCLKGEKA